MSKNAHECICGAPARYRCPGCGVRTCSVPCVQRHKTESGCDGRKHPERFAAKGALSDQLLRDDYLLLEDAARVADAAKRSEDEFGTLRGPKWKRDRLTPAKKLVLRNARDRGVHYFVQPAGMSLSKENTTRFYRKRKRKKSDGAGGKKARVVEEVDKEMLSGEKEMFSGEKEKEGGDDGEEEEEEENDGPPLEEEIVHVKEEEKEVEDEVTGLEKKSLEMGDLQWRVRILLVEREDDVPLEIVHDRVSDAKSLANVITDLVAVQVSNLRLRRQCPCYEKALRNAAKDAEEENLASPSPDLLNKAFRLLFLSPFAQTGARVVLERPIQATLRDALRGMPVLEFPTFILAIRHPDYRATNPRLPDYLLRVPEDSANRLSDDSRFVSYDPDVKLPLNDDGSR